MNGPTKKKSEVREDWSAVGFILGSSKRMAILKELSRSEATPRQLSLATGIPLSHISNGLGSLASKNLVVCLSPELRKGRVYSITEPGRRALRAADLMLTERGLRSPEVQ